MTNVAEKKIKTKYAFDVLMKKMEQAGYKWANDKLPTEWGLPSIEYPFYIHIWDDKIITWYTSSYKDGW